MPQNIFAPLGEIIPAATPAQRAVFAQGRDVARRRFTPETGLGPSFNVVSCVSCHERPVLGGGGARYRSFLLVGQQLPDGSFTNTGINGIQAQYSLATSRGADAAHTNVTATRTPIPFFGAGLIAELSDEAILVNADPDDRDRDGISGRPNYDRGFVGRFGRKAQTVSIEGFIRGPLFNHGGITSNPLSERRKAMLPVPSSSVCGGVSGGTSVECQAAALDEPTVDDDGVADPELSEDDLFALVSFVMLTAVPTPDAPTEETLRGQRLFTEAQCARCHTPTLRSPRGLLPLYSDLLLHDMGAALADGVRMKDASGSEFRTQPLWGIVAQGPYLHDGRADTLHDAIAAHGGEAQASRDRYMALAEADQQTLVAFLRSLGGSAQRTDGLLAPNAPVDPVGAYGGPTQALGEADRAVFERGRRVFDRDTHFASGLGPLFNGDSCRACHFDPVLGGAGPRDVDVVRQAIVDARAGTARAPESGSMAPRHGRHDARPGVAAESNYFETRQTPPLFGLGLIDRIPDAAIIALADPDDRDADGVRGRAARLADGRLGRFGWKANVPSLAEFARDALTNELGLTVPNDPRATFGLTRDGDSIADPEVTPSDLADLTRFLELLGPPPRTRGERALEDQGEALFARVRCDACHTPSLRTAEGTAVPLYSDLLLHDVLAPGHMGVPADAAGPRDFRTAPLWGLATSAPYMHDGRASTVEAAIAAHDGEASASVRAVSTLAPAERAALLAFLRSL